MITAVEAAAGLRIATVESVSADEIVARLEQDAPASTALNAGSPVRFPRINAHVLIPTPAGSIVGLVAWVGIRAGQEPRLHQVKDPTLVHLPHAIRRVKLVPLGMLGSGPLEDAAEIVYTLRRGISVFPSVGDPVHLPTGLQAQAIVGGIRAGSLKIGQSPVAANADVFVSPDRLFSRHLAILGNTGSGKSCTVAGIVRWAIEAGDRTGPPVEMRGARGRFIIFDPNGEYARAFDGLDVEVRVFKPASAASLGTALTVPAWLWNGNEWSALLSAGRGVQRPALLRALRDLRGGVAIGEKSDERAGRLLREYAAMLNEKVVAGPKAYSGDWKTCQDTGNLLSTGARVAAELLAENAAPPLSTALESVKQTLLDLESKNKGTSTSYSNFIESDLKKAVAAMEAAYALAPDPTPTLLAGEDAPIPFDVMALPSRLEQLARDPEFSQAAQHIPALSMRLRTMLADPRLREIIAPTATLDLKSWLTSLIGDKEPKKGQITIVDLSLVPSEITHIVAGVIARLVFEALIRFRREHKRPLPTVVVLDEAHHFLLKHADAENSGTPAAHVCQSVFERISREGRKFGLGLILASQRPSEISPTVLSQCNTFILHRIVNDRDQDLLRRLVPDNLSGLLSELPSLPSREAIIVGHAVALPTLLRVTELPEDHRPQSSDTEFLEAWSGGRGTLAEWSPVLDKWVA